MLWHPEEHARRKCIKNIKGKRLMVILPWMAATVESFHRENLTGDSALRKEMAKLTYPIAFCEAGACLKLTPVERADFLIEPPLRAQI